MKLIIQIPCYNEEATLPDTLRDLPRTFPGVDEIEFLVVDDGSVDRTVQWAQELRVRHDVGQKPNRKLATAGGSSLESMLASGDDLIVNTTGDNSYYGVDGKTLILPTCGRCGRH